MSTPLSIAPATAAFPTRLFGALDIPPSAIIDFPEGIPGFPFARRFTLLQAANRRLRWLQSLDSADLAFLLVEWAAVAKPLPEFSDNAYAIVTLPRRDQPATVNLAAPVLVDPLARSGQQMIRANAALPTAASFDLEGLLQAS